VSQLEVLRGFFAEHTLQLGIRKIAEWSFGIYALNDLCKTYEHFQFGPADPLAYQNSCSINDPEMITAALG
jgi:hypothetical protein